MRIVNVTRDACLATNAARATTIWSRGLGLMGRRHLPIGYGLVIDPCRGIHTFFMRLAIDVCYVDRSDVVVHVARGVKPWRVGPVSWRGAYVIELPAGAAEGTGAGDSLAFE